MQVFIGHELAAIHKEFSVGLGSPGQPAPFPRVSAGFPVLYRT